MRLLCALLPFFGFAPFDPVDSEFDAGGRMLGGGVRDGGGRHLFVPTLSSTALTSYQKQQMEQNTVIRQPLNGHGDIH